MIEIRDLHKSYGELNILNGLNMKIEQGEVVVVIGPSGSGKSTFLRCLNLLETPTAGDILFEGMKINDKSMILTRRELKWAWSSNPSTCSLICR